MSGPNYRQSLALEDSHGSVKDYFILVKEPGRALDKKRPIMPTSDGAQRMMMELLHHRPNAALTLVQLTWDDDLWVEDGRDDLAETATCGGIELPDGRIATIRFKDPGIEVWVKEAGRRPRKSSGGHRGSHGAVDAIVALFGEAITPGPAASTTLASGNEQVTAQVVPQPWEAKNPYISIPSPEEREGVET